MHRAITVALIATTGVVVAIPASPANAALPGTLAVCSLNTDTRFTLGGRLIYQGTGVWRTTTLADGLSLGPLDASLQISQIFSGGYGLFATSTETGDIYRFGNGQWDRIGGPGAEFAVTREGLYGLTPDRSAIYRYTGTGTAWTRYSGPAEHLYAGGLGLFATGRLTGNLYKVSPAGMLPIGNPGAEFVITDQSVYGLTPDRSAIYRYHGSTWSRVGGSAAHVYGGGYDTLLATSPSTGNVLIHTTGTSWTVIGGPGASFVATNAGTIFGLTPSKQAIYRYNNNGTSWTKVSLDSPERQIVACP